MVHVIDRNGRHAAIFHGAEFQKTNLTLYVNALTRRNRRSRRVGGNGSRAGSNGGKEKSCNS